MMGEKLSLKMHRSAPFAAAHAAIRGNAGSMATFDMNAPIFPQGHPFVHKTDAEYVYFAHPFPLVRAPANVALYRQLSEYEGFTCLKAGTRAEDGQIDRESGRVQYSWKKNTPPLTASDQAKFIRTGLLKEQDVLAPLRDAETGIPVTGHAGSVNCSRPAWSALKTGIQVVGSDGGRIPY